MELQHPHDKYFKWLMNSAKNAREFLIHYLPQDISALIDPDTVKIRKDSFIDKKLRERLLDINDDLSDDGSSGNRPG